MEGESFGASVVSSPISAAHTLGDSEKAVIAAGELIAAPLLHLS